MRGNERKNIFIDEEDPRKFIEILISKKELSCYDLYAYCLMGNHVHLLIKENEESISQIMKRINVSYAYHFNKKYSRVGHVFQDRYKSEAIEREKYLLAVVRYIHNNPVKAKITNSPSKYKWSSFVDYINEEIGNELVDKEFILSLFSNDHKESLRLFKEFSRRLNNDEFIDVSEEEGSEVAIHGYLSAKEYIDEYLTLKKIKINDLKKTENKERRKEVISYLKIKSDLSIRDIAKLLDIDRGVVDREKT